MSAASSAQVLPQAAGWASVVALGFGFSLLMIGITALQGRYTSLDARNQDEFSSASRSVKKGLIACGICSAWTWSATLLQSSAVAYKFGISGPYAYGAGATIQILLFAMLAIKIKQNAPSCSTFLQIIRERWGTTHHVVFTFFAFVTNILVGSMLVAGGSATINLLTGMPTEAAIVLLPISVAVYTATGGMRSTLVADYLHTAALVAIILAFAFVVYTTNDKIGSAGKMVDLLTAAAQKEPVHRNQEGSYLTFRSVSGLIFGIVNVCGNMGTVFADQAYTQRAIASASDSATMAFILGGIAWLAIPLTMATTMGLAARALIGVDPAMANLTPAEVSAGLPAPAAAAALMGKAGAAATLILLILAVTSALSAELIATSSVLTFDVYIPYMRPQASKRSVFLVSHLSIAVWAAVLAGLGIMFNKVGISMGWLYTFMGIVIGGSVFPIFACLCWSKANKMSCLVAPLASTLLAVAAWLGTTKGTEGSLTIDTTSADYPLLAGNLIAVFLPVVIVVPWSYLLPENYDFVGTRAIGAPSSATPGDVTPAGSEQDEKDIKSDGSPSMPALDAEPKVTEEAYTAALHSSSSVDRLEKEYKRVAALTIFMTFVLLILVPAMAVIPKVWTKAGFGVWIAMCIGWLFLTAAIVVVLPIVESKEALGQIFAGIAKDLTGKDGSYKK